jgi:RNA polymerase sigma-70 factor (ECF subfamily)
VTQQLSDQAIIGLVKRGERDAYRLIVERYQDRLIALANDVLKNRTEAEDVVQESFVKAYLALESFKGDSSFYTWLYRITYHMAIDTRRKSGRRVEISSSTTIGTEDGAPTIEATLEAPPESAPEVYLENKQRATCVDAALNGISPEHRAIILMREVDGLSYDEIAEVVGISKGTVMSRLHYARKRIQQALSGLWSGKDCEMAANIKPKLSSISE